MAKIPKQMEGAVIRSSLSCFDRGCRSLWSAQPRAGAERGTHARPSPPAGTGPAALPVAPALANAQLLLPDLESWDCPCCTS